ncbi:hypothetical protein ACFUYE_32685 [Micromonospora humida]
MNVITCPAPVAPTGTAGITTGAAAVGVGQAGRAPTTTLMSKEFP